MWPTNTDFARDPKVSLTTVDRLLNDRAGIVAKTQAKLNTAIEKLGYIREASTANLNRYTQVKCLMIHHNTQLARRRYNSLEFRL